ncbi:MAG: hypothetical protein N4A35_01945 [Flavobacteriales bacterium]|jgi:hypothetical protein|nr:hypothetical protein [Flavobacteriales bacterium]
MKTTKVLILAGAISLTLNSCFLFRSKHESCPAYGEEIKQQNELNQDLKNERIKATQEA